MTFFLPAVILLGKRVQINESASCRHHRRGAFRRIRSTVIVRSRPFSPPRPTSGSQSYFVPPPSGPHSTKPRAEIKVPQPEGVSIDEQYAKGSVVIINHERALYFVEDAGRATRYPVAIGSPVDQWEGVQTVTAKRETPNGFRPKISNWRWAYLP